MNKDKMVFKKYQQILFNDVYKILYIMSNEIFFPSVQDFFNI